MEYFYTSNYSSSSSSSISSLMRTITQKCSASKSPFLIRNLSQKSSLSHNSPPLSRNSSLKRFNSFKSPLSRSFSKKSKYSALSRTNSSSSSRKCSAFARKCSSLAKEQRARFYIMKRCEPYFVRDGSAIGLICLRPNLRFMPSHLEEIVIILSFSVYVRYVDSIVCSNGASLSAVNFKLNSSFTRDIVWEP